MATNDRKSAREFWPIWLGKVWVKPLGDIGKWRETGIAPLTECTAHFAEAYAAERVSVLERALREVLEWERDYRTINHLGQTPPQVFRQAEAALAETERNTL